LEHEAGSFLRQATGSGGAKDDGDVHCLIDLSFSFLHFPVGFAGSNFARLKSATLKSQKTKASKKSLN
jgi:hypothetical protein